MCADCFSTRGADASNARTCFCIVCNCSCSTVICAFLSAAGCVGGVMFMPHIPCPDRKSVVHANQRQNLSLHDVLAQRADLLVADDPGLIDHIGFRHPVDPVITADAPRL